MKLELMKKIGFITAILGFLGLLFGRLLFFFAPITFLCGILIILKKQSYKDILSGISCLIVSVLLLYYLIKY